MKAIPPRLLCAIITALGIPALPVAGQTAPTPESLADSIRVEIDRASIEGDDARLEEARVLAERAVTAYPDDGLLHYYLGEAMYRQATTANSEEARRIAERAEEVLRRAAELNPLPETWALIGTAIGLQIGANPLKGMLLGPKSTSAVERALALAENNPRAWMLHGTAAIHTPSMFGGGLDRATERLERAIALFETDAPPPPLPAWGHAECYAWLGIAKMQSDDLEGAEAAFASALALEPGFAWVRDVLMSQLEQERRGRR